MTVESATYVSQLNSAYPAAGDQRSEGDDHIRLIKTALSNSIGSLGAAALTVTAAQVNSLAASGGLYSVGTSTTSLAVGTGSKAFTTQTGLGFAIGQNIKITSDANSANYMIGVCTTYTTGTGAMVVNVTSVGGSGTVAAWSITVFVNEASSLASATTSVNVSAAAAPAAFDVLMATGSTAATWQSVAGNNVVTVHTGNGYGSSSTKVRRWTTAMTNTGTAITYADSSTLGGTFTINETGIYSMTLQDCKIGVVSFIGVSLNSNQLTTVISAISIANRLIWGRVENTGIEELPGCISTTRRLVAGDVIRVHDDGTNDSASDRSNFSICKVSV